MQIRSLKKIPIAAKNMAETVYNKMISEGKSEIIATRVAWEVTKRHFQAPVTAKSTTFSQSYTLGQNNTIDVLLGFPTVDAHGEMLTESFWANKPMHPISGDMEHIHFQKAEGMLVDYPAEWDGWIPMADSFYHKDGGLWAKVEVPQGHPYTPTFMKEWESGKYGVSIEYTYPEEAVEYKFINDTLVPTITSGKITGFTFTENPAINTKKNG